MPLCCSVLLGFSALCRVRTLTGVEFDQSKVDRGQTVLIGVSEWANARDKSLYLPAWDVMNTAVDIKQVRRVLALCAVLQSPARLVCTAMILARAVRV